MSSAIFYDGAIYDHEFNRKWKKLLLSPPFLCEINIENDCHYYFDVSCFTSLSYLGMVQGPEDTGSIPVAGVTITWSFASNPDVAGVGITNSDGLFINSADSIGFNLQVQ